MAAETAAVVLEQQFFRRTDGRTARKQAHHGARVSKKREELSKKQRGLRVKKTTHTLHGYVRTLVYSYNFHYTYECVHLEEKTILSVFL